MLSSVLLSFLRCPVFRRLREEAEKRKRPSWNELKGRKGEGELSGEAKHSATQSRNPTRDQPEPGLINPAYEESEEGMETAYLTSYIHLIYRSTEFFRLMTVCKCS